MPRRASDTTREENISHTRRTCTVRVCLWRTHGSYVLNMRFDQAVRGRCVIRLDVSVQKNWCRSCFAFMGKGYSRSS